MVELKKVDLTEEQMMQKKHMLNEIETEIEAQKIDISSYEKMIELKLPEQRARNALAKKKDELKIMERNAQIIRIQLRERKESIIP